MIPVKDVKEYRKPELSVLSMKGALHYVEFHHGSGVVDAFLRPAKRFCAVVSTRMRGSRTATFLAPALMGRTPPIRPRARHGIRDL